MSINSGDQTLEPPGGTSAVQVVVHAAEEADFEAGPPGVAHPVPPESRGKLLLRWLGLVALWHRLEAEFWVEWDYARWWRLVVIVLCLIFQYLHAIATTLAYHLHEPLLPPNPVYLHDIGFEVLSPEITNDAVTEAFVYTGFGLFAMWLASPFYTRQKRFHAVVVLKRVLVMLVALQALRIISFLATQLPAPAAHCRYPEPTATLPWPDHWWQNIVVDVGRQASQSCGDLIFSSHNLFLLVFTYTFASVFAFAYTLTTSLLTIASRKHYTVDVVVAWYVVPLAFFHFKRRWTTTRDDVCTPDNLAIVACMPPLGGAHVDVAKAQRGPADVRAGLAGAAGKGGGHHGDLDRRGGSDDHEDRHRHHETHSLLPQRAFSAPAAAARDGRRRPPSRQASRGSPAAAAPGGSPLARLAPTPLRASDSGLELVGGSASPGGAARKPAGSAPQLAAQRWGSGASSPQLPPGPELV